MHTLEAIVAENLPKDSRLLLSVSGGADSCCLLKLCCQIRSRHDLELGVAHIDHGLRPDSAQDGEFVRELARTNQLEFYITRLAPIEAGQNIERWGREERYKFLQGIRSDHGYDWILTAHSADDRAETLLMRLLSNKELRTIEARDERRRLLRPMLQIYRAQIMEYLRLHALEYREDPSNTDRRFLRNRIRHDLMPVVQSITNGAGLQILADRAQALAQDLECLDQLLTPSLSRISQEQFGSRAWLRTVQDELSALNEGLQWRLCEALLDPILNFHVGRKHAKRVLEFFLSNFAEIELPANWVLRRKDGGVNLLRR